MSNLEPGRDSFCGLSKMLLAHSKTTLFSFKRRHIPLTVMPCGEVLAAQALPRHWVAVIGVAIALAGLAAWKSPEPGQAAVTLPCVHPLEAVALASDGVAESIDRSLQMALTSWRNRQPRDHVEKLVKCKHISYTGWPPPFSVERSRASVVHFRSAARLLKLWNTHCMTYDVNEYVTVLLINLRLHPLGPKPKVPGAHLSHLLPTTFGRHWHWPPLGSQTELKEPWGSHSQAAGKTGKSPWPRAAMLAMAISPAHPTQFFPDPSWVPRLIQNSHLKH